MDKGIKRPLRNHDAHNFLRTYSALRGPFCPEGPSSAVHYCSGRFWLTESDFWLGRTCIPSSALIFLVRHSTGSLLPRSLP